jgi:hypothetical protein
MSKTQRRRSQRKHYAGRRCLECASGDLKQVLGDIDAIKPATKVTQGASPETIMCYPKVDMPALERASPGCTRVLDGILTESSLGEMTDCVYSNVNALPDQISKYAQQCFHL